MRHGARKHGTRKRTDMGEFFVTQIGEIERTPEFVRLTFFSDLQIIALALPPSAFVKMASLIAMAPDGALN